MPPLRNARHERFAQLIVEGMPATRAYIEAGYRPNQGNPSKLKSLEAIQSRMTELLTERAVRLEENDRRVAQSLAIDKAWLMSKLRNVIELAESKQDANAITNAIKELGVLSGERIEKSEHGRPGDFAAIEAMSRAELIAYITDGLPALDEPKLIEHKDDGDAT